MRVLLPVLFLAVLAGLSRADDADKPVPRKDNAVWRERHEALQARARKGGIDVVFLGDTPVQGWEGPDGQAAWKKHFEPLKAANFGAGGDHTEHVLWRVSEGKELDGASPKVIVLYAGGGNLSANSVEEIGDGVGAILKELAAQKPGAKVLLLGLLPRGTKANDKYRDKIKEVNARLAKLADGKAVRALDVGDKFLDKEGDLLPEVMPDGLHLSAKGYALWAEALHAPLGEMLKK